ncbi:MAG: hypothetical protein R3E89_14395 [Thiolinea sp.]
MVSALLQRKEDGQDAGYVPACLKAARRWWRMRVQLDLEGTESPPMPDREFSAGLHFHHPHQRQIFIGLLPAGTGKLCVALWGWSSCWQASVAKPHGPDQQPQLTPLIFTAAVAARDYAELAPARAAGYSVRAGGASGGNGR